MKLTLAWNEQNRCCLTWIPICIFKEPHCQGLSTAMSWIVYAWKITNQMFCSLWWSSAITFFCPFHNLKLSKTPSARLWLDYLLQEFLEHPLHCTPVSVLLIIFLLYSRLVSLCSAFHMSKTHGEALNERGTFSTFGILYFWSAVESQGFSGKGMCKHFLE